MDAKKPDAQTELMRAAWLKGFQEGEITLTFASKSDLTNIRFKLYNMAKQVKKQGAMAERMLLDAVENCSIGIKEIEGGKWQLRIYRQDRSLVLQDLAAQLNMSLTNPAEKSQEADAEAAAALAKVMEKMEQAQATGGERFSYPMKRG